LKNNLKEKLYFYANYFYNNNLILILFLVFLKLFFQVIIINSGYKWLSADDYCRTVKSFEWLQHPVINSGVWLTPHFWLNGFFMLFIKDLVKAAAFVNVFFSTICLIYFYKLSEKCFNKQIALVSSLIFIFFPFQVWLGISGLPESIFGFFITTGIYYYILFKQMNKRKYLVYAAISFMLSNLFRYEGWLFSIIFVLLPVIDILRNKKINRKLVINFLVTLISFISILWWLAQNYIDYRDIFFFAKETTKIYDQFSTAKIFQRFIQYPVFIFYIAPITTILALKSFYDIIRCKNGKLSRIFLFFVLGQLLFLMIHGLSGTGGTNMISRYIVINAVLIIPFSVYQIFKFKKIIGFGTILIIILINIIWSFFYPSPYREDTFEVGVFTKNQLKFQKFKPDEKIYFEELEGQYDIFGVQAISNNPSVFISGNFPVLKVQEDDTKKKKRKNSPTEEEINILDIKNYLEKNKVNIAIVKSDGYADKLKKINFKNEEIGDYKIFYIKDRETNLSDSTIDLFSNNISTLDDKSETFNFGRLLAIRNFKIDNTNFGLNPQTITIDWYSVSKDIFDSLDYENYDFDRFTSVVEIKNNETDSTVHIETKKIFSERSVEDLVAENSVKSIIVIRPFALLYYSVKFTTAPFESGAYELILKVRDNKYNRDLPLYKGNKLYKPDTLQMQDTSKTKRNADTLKTKTKPVQLKNKITDKDSLFYEYDMGQIIAMFPNTNYEKLLTKSGVDVYRYIVKNAIQIFFSQRYQGDHFLNWVFTNF
jgi:hypothetical protein